MNCKKCGMPTVEGATFCGYCGERVDGKKPCEACGQLNDENFAFCCYCGTRIDGKTACKTCGTVYEGSFCPACGNAKKTSPAKEKSGKAKQGRFGKICEIIGGGLMMAGVLLSLIFVFFIGLELAGEKTTIFTFFGEYYKEMKASGLGDVGETTSKWWVDLFENQITLYGVVGTVISSVTLLSVVAFSTVAIVKYVLSWVRKTENTANGWALASVVSYLVGAVLFFAHVRMRIVSYGSVDLGGMDFSAMLGNEGGTEFNGVTVVGIVLGLVAVGLGLIANMLSKGKTPWTGKRILGTVFGFAGVVFGGVILAVSQFSASGFDFFSEEGSLEFFAGFGLFNQAWDVVFCMLLQMDVGAKAYSQATTVLAQMNAFNVICMLSVVGLAVVAGGALCSNARGMQGGKSCAVIWLGLALAFSVVFLVFNILAWNSFMEVFEIIVDAIDGDMSAVEFNGKFAAPICAVVFSAISLAVAIVRSVFVKKQEVFEV